MRPIVLGLTLIAFVGACENSTDPLFGFGGGGATITQAQATGNWSFTVTKTTTFPCSGTPLANGQVVTAHTDVLSDGTVTSATSTWQNPISGAIQPLSGSVDLSLGVTRLTFAAPAVSSTAGMELRGTMTSAGTFAGTLADPASGFTPVFSTGACEYSVNGTKTS